MLDSNFHTQDLHLAVWLKIQGIELIDIIPQARFRSKFIFAPVPQQLLDKWVSTEAPAPVRNTIAEYRHLLRQVRQAEEQGGRR
jgi:hypothetical protein